MSPRLLGPAEAAATLADRIARLWPEWVCAELTGSAHRPIEVGLRPGVGSKTAIEGVGREHWTDWGIEWAGIDLDGLPGVSCENREVRDDRVSVSRPYRLRIETLDAGLAAIGRLGGTTGLDLARFRRVASRLRAAGVGLTPALLKRVCDLSEPDLESVVSAVAWLSEHPDLGGWTLRQLPIPGVHTKWLADHLGLMRDLTGRDLAAETRPRLSVVHLTYADPRYLAGGARRHDAWTSGDRHDPAYRPRVVVIVENRDARLWFPENPETVVVEGGGKAAAQLAGEIPWLLQAERVIYWGDMDCDGFAILNHLRAELGPRGVRVESLLMDEMSRVRYAHLGVNHDRNGVPLRPSGIRLPHLRPAEAECYASVATRGDAAFRRIEQERIGTDDVAAALTALLSGDSDGC
ncbi:MAG: DUF2220 family protein [Propionibacteriaceae bacterium]|nr:DUF2220 family protein [Propionibacteriaceae bacterium]